MGEGGLGSWRQWGGLAGGVSVRSLTIWKCQGGSPDPHNAGRPEEGQRHGGLEGGGGMSHFLVKGKDDTWLSCPWRGSQGNSGVSHCEQFEEL